MIYVDNFYIKVLEDIIEPEADLGIIIPYAIVRLLEKTNIFGIPDTLTNGLIFLESFFHDLPEMPGHVGVLPDLEKKLLSDLFINN
ncbi:hypothetical protein LCGC14_1217930 [marine sediment metagenome]|uniref:Uncharacterized protein n=1 Tax=marine sediment metagenome TaxID=412755 RepID=A0A0F9PGP1_9ZZZZ|nr:hypothetical protein [bacterium]